MNAMLAAHLDPLAASLFSLLAIASLLLAFVMLGSRWLKDYMLAFAAQSWLIGMLSALIGYYGGYRELYWVALLTVLFRGIVLPWLILRILRRLNTARELHEVLSTSTSLVIGAAAVIFARPPIASAGTLVMRFSSLRSMLPTISDQLAAGTPLAK